jgi:hypothetical protein
MPCDLVAGARSLQYFRSLPMPGHAQNSRRAVSLSGWRWEVTWPAEGDAQSFQRSITDGENEGLVSTQGPG